MNWYNLQKTSSAKDEKQEQMKFLEEKIVEAIDQALIGGNETINLLERLTEWLRGDNGVRNLIPPSIKEAILALIAQAIEVKRDSPQKCCAILEEALTYLY